MGVNLPKQVMVVEFATNQIYDFGEQLSPLATQVVSKQLKLSSILYDESYCIEEENHWYG